MSKPVKILLVEEERLIAMDLEQLLARKGYRVLLALRSAEDAIAYSRINKPDVIVMDLYTEGRITGYKAADIFLKMNIPVVMLDGTLASDYEIDDDPNMIMVSKPFNEDALLFAINKLANSGNE